MVGRFGTHGIAFWDVVSPLGLKDLLRCHHHLLPCVALGDTGGHCGATAPGTGAVWDTCTPCPLHPCWNAQGVSPHPRVSCCTHSPARPHALGKGCSPAPFTTKGVDGTAKEMEVTIPLENGDRIMESQSCYGWKNLYLLNTFR